jgi:hypothetical protein
VPESASALSFTVHSMPSPVAEAEAAPGRTARGRRLMFLVLAVCAAPVIASYIAYFLIRPDSRTNYSELILPPRPIPAGLGFTDLQNRPVAAESLKGQWLIVVVSTAACDAACERHLWIQRQLREALGRDSGRVDKVWLITDPETPRPETLRAVSGVAPATVLRAPAAVLGRWLQAGPGQRLEDHMYIVDPRGDWMMRVPPNPEPMRLKRDIDKLLRASSGWDEPGR